MKKRIISYNVNGIRAAVKKGFLDWLDAADPDVLCLQEIKAMPEQVDDEVHERLKYHTFWYPAEKKGYSGVAIFAKEEPTNVTYGIEIEKYDQEGRVLRVDFETYSVISVYMPSGTTGDVRQAFKMQWLSDFEQYIQELRKEIPHLVICGDYNICHKPIDIHNPVRLKNTSGFLPEEREWVSGFLECGFIDSFRHFNHEPHQYSWWSYRAGARKKNLGWRLDYALVDERLRNQLSRAAILSDAVHSDHCPVLLELDFSK